MSFGAAERSSARSAWAVGLAGVALLAAAALLVAGGPVGTLRTVVGLLAVLVIPGWLVGRLFDEEGDAIVRVVGGTVVTIGFVVLTSVISYELGLRVATAVVAIPLLVLVAVAALLGTTGAPVRRARLVPLATALGIGAVALLGAMTTHLALPAVPIEPAFSMEAKVAVVSPTTITVNVTVTQVHTGQPTYLTLYAYSAGRASTADHASVSVPRREGVQRISLRVARPAGAPACPGSLRVRIRASNGAYLTPTLACVGR